MPLRLKAILAGLLVIGMSTAAQAQNKRDATVNEDRERVSALREWIYNDLPAGIREAKRIGRPLMIVFR